MRHEEESKNAMVIPDEELVAEYYQFKQQLEQMAADFKLVITHPTYCLPFLQPGRLINVKYQKLDFGWGVIINYQKRVPPKVKLNIELHLLYFSLMHWTPIILYRIDQRPNLKSIRHTSNTSLTSC